MEKLKYVTLAFMLLILFSPIIVWLIDIVIDWFENLRK